MHLQDVPPYMSLYRVLSLCCAYWCGGESAGIQSSNTGNRFLFWLLTAMLCFWPQPHTPAVLCDAV